MNRVKDYHNAPRQIPVNRVGAPSTRQPNLKYWFAQIGYAVIGFIFIVVVKVLVFAGIVGISSL